jgi:uncharacterized membrane protein YiaA
MLFQYYTNAISRASKNFAAGIFLAGLFLFGIGVLITAMPELIGYIVAALFFVAGFVCCVTAAKILLTIKKIDSTKSNPEDAYRENVHIRIEQHLDQ